MNTFKNKTLEVFLVMLTILIPGLFGAYQVGFNDGVNSKSEEPKEKTVHCYVYQDEGPKLRGISCTQLNNEIVAVRLYLVERTIHVHPTRVKWVGEETDNLEKELLKPLQEEGR